MLGLKILLAPFANNLGCRASMHLFRASFLLDPPEHPLTGIERSGSMIVFLAHYDIPHKFVEEYVVSGFASSPQVHPNSFSEKPSA